MATPRDVAMHLTAVAPVSKLKWLVLSAREPHVRFFVNSWVGEQHVLIDAHRVGANSLASSLTVSKLAQVDYCPLFRNISKISGFACRIGWVNGVESTRGLVWEQLWCRRAHGLMG